MARVEAEGVERDENLRTVVRAGPMGKGAGVRADVRGYTGGGVSGAVVVRRQSENS